jgi:hypothetical protein
MSEEKKHSGGPFSDKNMQTPGLNSNLEPHKSSKLYKDKSSKEPLAEEHPEKEEQEHPLSEAIGLGGLAIAELFGGVNAQPSMLQPGFTSQGIVVEAHNQQPPSLLTTKQKLIIALENTAKVADALDTAAKAVTTAAKDVVIASDELIAAAKAVTEVVKAFKVTKKTLIDELSKNETK